MKIHDKPQKEHYTNKNNQEQQGICKVKNGYTIRHTQNKTVYYYGCYKTIQEATHINKQLQQQKYPIKYSSNQQKTRGKKYKEILKKLLNKKEGKKHDKT